MSLSPLLLNAVLEVLATAIDKKRKRKKERKGIQIRKEEVKLSLCPYDMTLCRENLKDTNKKLLKLTNEFN